METLISFRAPEPLVEETGKSAKLLGLSKSEYARRAIEAMNHRVMRQRIAMLSKKFSAKSLAENLALDAATLDGLDG